jgi:hypothetical protein
MTSELAVRIHGMVLNAAKAIDESVAAMQAEGNPTDLLGYRRAAGCVLDAIMEELLKPLYREHPELIPPELDRRYLNL